MLAHIDHPDSSVKSGSPREQEVLTRLLLFGVNDLHSAIVEENGASLCLFEAV